MHRTIRSILIFAAVLSAVFLFGCAGGNAQSAASAAPEPLYSDPSAPVIEFTTLTGCVAPMHNRFYVSKRSV